MAEEGKPEELAKEAEVAQAKDIAPEVTPQPRIPETKGDDESAVGISKGAGLPGRHPEGSTQARSPSQRRTPWLNWKT